METKSHLYLAKGLGYLKDAEAIAIFDLIKDLGVRLNNTISALSQQQSKRQG